MPTSKRQLRANRRHALNAWLAQQDLRLDEAPFWTAEQQAAESAKFAELDAAYEAAKTALADELKAMSEPEWLAWCDEIGWTPVGATQAEQVDDYILRA